MNSSKLMTWLGLMVTLALNAGVANAQSWYGDYGTYGEDTYCPYSNSQYFSGYNRNAGPPINYRYQFASCPVGSICPYDLQGGRTGWSRPYASRSDLGQCTGCREQSFNEFAEGYRSQYLRQRGDVSPRQRAPNLEVPADQVPRLDNSNESNVVPIVPPTSPSIQKPPQLSPPSFDNSNTRRLESGVAQGPPPADLLPPSLGSSSSQNGHADCEHCKKN